jgi:hypothetical protein
MELSYLMLTGSLSGLVSVLLHAVLGSGLDVLRGRGAAATTWSVPLQISDALLHMLCGLGLGLLFWLSWGLAAVVSVPWWVRGLSFGSLCWLALVVPSVLSVALTADAAIKVAATMASRWATTCLIAGLACSWSWRRLF